MDINEIKKMIKGKNDRIIIVDNDGNPAFVISAYNSSANQDQNQEVPEQKVEENDHDFQTSQEKSNNRVGRLTIEDLPYL
ncbi:hypothetical protein KBC01_01200 [Candidatus Parcubacteria bacterium]|nr:hypothetical protein [Candidatus Parcubacteria bacterium]